jgi:hypothetical protein
MTLIFIRDEGKEDNIKMNTVLNYHHSSFTRTISAESSFSSHSPILNEENQNENNEKISANDNHKPKVTPYRNKDDDRDDENIQNKHVNQKRDLQTILEEDRQRSERVTALLMKNHVSLCRDKRKKSKHSIVSDARQSNFSVVISSKPNISSTTVVGKEQNTSKGEKYTTVDKVTAVDKSTTDDKGRHNVRKRKSRRHYDYNAAFDQNRFRKKDLMRALKMSKKICDRMEKREVRRLEALAARLFQSDDEQGESVRVSD